MITFLLVLRDRGVAVDFADSPEKLDFSKVAGARCYEVNVQFTGSTRLYPLAAVDLMYFADQAAWIAEQLCKEIDFRRAFPGFEDEIKRADGPLVAFGEPNIGPNGFIE